MKNERHVTPAWMTIKQAAAGWGVSERQARRIIRQVEEEKGRRVSERGRLKTTTFLAIHRGDMAGKPMIPDIDDIWAKLDALSESHARMLTLLGQHHKTLEGLCKALGYDPKTGQIRTRKPI